MVFRQNNTIFSVSELTSSIRRLLEVQYRHVRVEGEVSNLKKPYSGHIYFTLKDANAQIRAVIFRSQLKFVDANLKEGQKVLCYGRISVYEPRGEYQLIVDSVDVAGVGSLQLQFEALKQSLLQDGLFDPDKKQEITNYPDHIVLVTSPTGAAVQDFLKITSMRGFYGKVSIYPVKVQGNESTQEIVSAIETVNKQITADLIVLTRGGGSLEDLWSFNQEATARAIYDSKIPIVTGIGHETDVTIADYCADLRTHTPTAAAEQVIPDCYSLLEYTESLKYSLISAIKAYLAEKSDRISSLRRIIGDLQLYLENLELKLDFTTSNLINILHKKIDTLESEFSKHKESLHSFSPEKTLILQQQRVQNLKNTIYFFINKIIEKKEDQLRMNAALLDSVSPLSVLARGYSIVKTKPPEKVEVVTDSAQVNKGDLVDVKLHKGHIECEVIDKSNHSIKD